MENPASNVAFNPKPIKVGSVWRIVATHAVSGQQEHIIGFHSEAEWLASNGCRPTGVCFEGMSPTEQFIPPPR